MIRMVDVGFLCLKQVMQLFLLQRITVALCMSRIYVTFSLHETRLLLCLGLFYGKCYVTIVIRELSHFSYRYLGKFLWEEIVSNHFYSSKTFGFYFCVLSLRFRIDCFLGEIYFSSFYFFLLLSKWQVFCSFAIYFFFVVMKRHNRFFEKWWLSVISLPDVVEPLCWLHKLHELPS